MKSSFRLDPKKPRQPTKTDLARIDRMKDSDIDYSDIPPLDEEFFRKAKRQQARKSQPTYAARRRESGQLAAKKRKETRLARSLLGEAVETILVNIAASGTKREITKALWLIGEIEDCTRFPDFEPLKGKLMPWFEAWRKGNGPSL